MSNPFSLKKEDPKTPFKNATMIICKDLGKGTAKKFLFDHNASEALKINDETLIAFIVSTKYLFLADVSHVDLEKWGLKDHEYNKFNKRPEYYNIQGGKFRFRSFSNASLFRVIGEEHELNLNKYNVFSLVLITGEDFSEYIDKGTFDLLKKMGIESIYLLNQTDDFDDFDQFGKDWWQAKVGVPSSQELLDYIKKTPTKVKGRKTKPFIKEQPMTTGYNIVDFDDGPSKYFDPNDGSPKYFDPFNDYIPGGSTSK